MVLIGLCNSIVIGITERERIVYKVERLSENVSMGWTEGMEVDIRVIWWSSVVSCVPLLWVQGWLYIRVGLEAGEIGVRSVLCICILLLCVWKGVVEGISSIEEGVYMWEKESSRVSMGEIRRVYEMVEGIVGGIVVGSNIGLGILVWSSKGSEQWLVRGRGFIYYSMLLLCVGLGVELWSLLALSVPVSIVYESMIWGKISRRNAKRER